MLTITYATWGYKGIFVDVANKLRREIEKSTAGDLIIYVDTDTLGDPCKGWVKELNVYYEYGGVKHQILVQEQHPHTNGGRKLSIKNGVATTNTAYPGLMEITGLI